MILTSLELSKKLVELGCRSESGFYYPYHDTQPTWGPIYDNAIHVHAGPTAFCIGDFVGQNETAKENRKKIFSDFRHNFRSGWGWHDPDVCKNCGAENNNIFKGEKCSEYKMYAMIDHEQGFEDYLWKVLR